MIEILTSGTLNSVQDLGRVGHLDAGVGHCGAMDLQALETANALLGNPPVAAGIEVAFFPFRMRFHRDLAFSIAGADCAATLDRQALPPNWATLARTGQTLILSAPRSGARAYIALLGGVDVPAVLGSRSTDQKGGFGGLAGRGFERGDRLAVGASAATPGALKQGLGASTGAAPLPRHTPGQTTTVRVLRAAEYPDFSAESLTAFFASRWQITPQANRQGYRLQGESLALKNPSELFSHGIVPGTIQVPPAGQPIIQLADANTCGGYPKIATVIEADLGLLAQAPIGSALRFEETDRATAILAARSAASRMAALRRASELLLR